MKLFQNSGTYPAYQSRLQQLSRNCSTFKERINVFLDDRFGACHFLKPVLDRDTDAFFTNGDDEKLQRQWARERGMRSTAKLADILLAQIEDHRTEIFYNLDPMRYQSDFLRRLPGCVKKSIAWRAAPSPGADFSGYDLVVCNFPGILRDYAAMGWRCAYFAPAHDPEMDIYAANNVRPVDVLFVGGYSRHHRRRAHVLEAVAALRKDYKIVFHLDRSKLTQLAESPIGQLLPIGAFRRPQEIREVSALPVFGRDLYAAISCAKVVLNGAVDMAGNDRGNMRCFEAMGCGAFMVSDAGNYPIGMEDGHSMLTYRDPNDAVNVIIKALDDPSRLSKVASEGTVSMRVFYSKQQQWLAFKNLLSSE